MDQEAVLLKRNSAAEGVGQDRGGPPDDRPKGRELLTGSGGTDGHGSD